MILAVDCDNVLLNLTEQVVNIYNKQNNDNIAIPDLITYSFYECLSKEKADRLCALFCKKELWNTLKPIKDSQVSIESLIKAGHTILVTTATHAKNFEWKCDLLKKLFPLINTNNIIRIMDKSYIKADIMVDDDIDQLIRHKLCHRICFDYPWNQQSEDKDFIYDIHRCKNWSEILEAINEIEKEYKNV